MSNVPDDKLVSLADLAKALGCTRTYAYQLHKEGRVVPEEAGSKRVWLRASVQRVQDTKDPSKAGVAARHASARQESAEEPGVEEAPEAPEGAAAGGFNFQTSKAKREHFAAAREEIEYRREAGALIEVSVASGAFADVGAMLGAGLDAIAPTLAPLLVGKDEVQIRNALQDYAEELRKNMAAKVAKAAKEWGSDVD
ncbi:MAG: hypothetical protein RSD57_13640 [Comamonas sp.]